MGVLRKSINLPIFQEECKPAHLLDGGSDVEYKPVNLLDVCSEEVSTMPNSRWGFEERV